MSRLSMNVVAGQRRQIVGTIEPQVGMLTSAGVIERVTPETVVFSDKSRRRTLPDVTVRHTTAVKFGYPFAAGCTRSVIRAIKKDGQLVEA